MTSLRLAAVAALLIGAAALSTSSTVTPVEKVISLISDLKTECEDQGKAEAASYDEFSCFCKDTTGKKSTSITEGQDNIDELSATISDKTATKVEKETEIQDRKNKQEELAAQLATTQANYQKDETEYEAIAADLSKALSSLQGAIKSIEDSKPASAALLQEVKKSLALADAMSLLERPKQQTVAAFLQGGAKVDPSDPDFKFHSQGILDLLDKLLKDFRAQKETLDKEWGKTEKNYQDKIADIKNEMNENKIAIETLEGEVETLKSEIAEARGSLVEAESLLTDDQAYLKDLTERCEARAGDWDQRSAMRRDEIEALSKALAILENDVKGAEGARALLQTSAKGEVAAPVAVSFLQAVSSRARAVSLLERARGLSAQVKRDQMLDLLQKEGKRLGSTILASLAMKLAADPFAKVKELIQKLIERLVKEATEEASKKGFCDTELGKARSDRDYRLQDVNKLNAELSGLEAKQDALEEEIETLTANIKQLEGFHAEQTKLRADEKAENLATMKTAKGGLKAVTEALTILKVFYKQAAKAAALVQASPVDEDTAGAGFKGNSQGNQESSKAILGLLETIKSDFERTFKTTEEMEAKSAAEYVELDRATKADIAGKTTKKELDEEDLETTKSTITKKMGDLKTNMNLMDKALEELEELKPACIDSGMSYQERVEKREEEMEALKKALCMLDGDNVEPECK